MADTSFSFQVIAVLVAALENEGHKLGQRHFEQMAQADNSRSAAAYQHMFRKVKARAREINAGTDISVSASTPTMKTKAQPKKRNIKKSATEQEGKAANVKKEKSGKAEEEDEAEDSQAEEMFKTNEPGSDNDEQQSPSRKKIKTEL